MLWATHEKAAVVVPFGVRVRNEVAAIVWDTDCVAHAGWFEVELVAERDGCGADLGW